MSEKFVVKGGLSIPSGQSLEIGGLSLSSILTGDTLSAGEANKLVIPSEYSVRTYIDTQIGAANQLTFTSDGDEDGLEIDLATETLKVQGGSNLTTSASGNQITVAMKDTISVNSLTSTSVDINGGTIDNTDVTVGAGKTLDVSAGTLTLAAGQIVSAMINGDAIDGSKIADNAVDSEHIVAGSVDNSHLAGSIANNKLVNDSVTITSGTGMSGGGELELGSTLTLSVDASLTHVTSVGALSGGSITSDFGAINNGASGITTTGNADLGATTVDSLSVSNGGITNAGSIAGATSIDGSGDLTMGTITMTGFSVDSDGDLTAKSINIGSGEFTGSSSNMLLQAGSETSYDTSSETAGTLVLQGESGIKMVDDVTLANSALIMDNAKLDTFIHTAASANAESVVEFAKADFKSAKVSLNVTDGSDYTAREVIVVTNGTTAKLVEYGVVSTGASDLGALTVAINGNNVELRVAVAIGGISTGTITSVE